MQALWQRLDEVDPAAAQKIHPNNVGRVVRALEVFYTTGTPISRQQELSRQQPSPYRLCMMALGFRDRQKLYDRINLRVTRMVEDGLEQEARWLREQGYSATSFQAIGYKEMGLYLDGEETLEQACERIRQESRRYAKRQLTWLPLVLGRRVCRCRTDAPADGTVGTANAVKIKVDATARQKIAGKQDIL